MIVDRNSSLQTETFNWLPSARIVCATVQTGESFGGKSVYWLCHHVIVFNLRGRSGGQKKPNEYRRGGELRVFVCVRVGWTAGVCVQLCGSRPMSAGSTDLLINSVADIKRNGRNESRQLARCRGRGCRKVEVSLRKEWISPPCTRWRIKMVGRDSR